MCIVRIVRGGSPLLETAIKQMYMAYVKNCKFTSPSTLPHINFMRRSLVEVLALDHSLAYYQAFIHIRQLAIHLRNAIVNKKKDSLQAVYNWQYVHSMELWGALLGHAADSEVLEPLIYPLVQVVLGTLRLVPTAKYFPLRFHCGAILTSLSSATGTFIPILPVYLGEKKKRFSFVQYSLAQNFFSLLALFDIFVHYSKFILSHKMYVFRRFEHFQLWQEV